VLHPQSDTVQQVLTSLQNRGLRLAILFGSIAAARENPESDIDIAVDCGRPLTSEEKLELINDLAFATGRPVDLIDLTTVGEPMLGQILQTGIRILGTKAHFAALLRKHLFDSADFLPYRRRILESRRRAWIAH
jgi:uncharacterized protein